MPLDLQDELGYPGVRRHRFDKQYVPGIYPHEFGAVPLAAPFHQDALGFLFIRACLLLDVEDVPECQVGRAVIIKPAEKDLAIVQEDSLVFGGKLEVASATRSQPRRKQEKKQNGAASPKATVILPQKKVPLLSRDWHPGYVLRTKAIPAGAIWRINRLRPLQPAFPDQAKAGRPRQPGCLVLEEIRSFPSPSHSGFGPIWFVKYAPIF
jgi:hypothetical protein